MKKLLLLLLFSIVPFLAFSQVIRGKVSDLETKKPVDFASVYINGIFLGCTTNEGGVFELNPNS